MARLRSMEPQPAEHNCTTGSNGSLELEPASLRTPPPERVGARKASFRVRGGPASRRRNSSRALRQSTVAALTSKFNSLSSSDAVVGAAKRTIKEEPRPKSKPPTDAARPLSPSKRRTTTHLPIPEDDLHVCEGSVKEAIKIFETIEVKKHKKVPNGKNESAGANNKAAPENNKESSSPRAKPKVMLKPSSSFISRKIKESRFSKELKEIRLSKELKKETAVVQEEPPALPKSAPPPKSKPSKSSLFLPLLSKYTTSAAAEPPPEPPKPELPARPPKEYFAKRNSLVEFKPLKEKNFLKAASSDNLMGAKPNKSALFGSSSSVSSSESYSSYEPVSRFGEARREFPSTIDEDDFDLTPTSDTSLVDEVMNELASKNIMPPCMMDISEPNTPRALPNESFLFSSAVQNCSNKNTPVEEKDEPPFDGEDYDDVYMSAVPRNSYCKISGATVDASSTDEVYDYPQQHQQSKQQQQQLPPRPVDEFTYDDCGPMDGIYEDTATVYESIGSCAPSYFEKNNSLYGDLELRAQLMAAMSSSVSVTSLGSASPSASRAGHCPDMMHCDEARSDLGGERRSETGSDEWVDVDLSEPEDEPTKLPEALQMIREKYKNRRSPSWSLKVRRQWHRTPKKKATQKVFVSTTTSTLCLVGREDAVAPRPQRPPRRKPPLVTLRLRVLDQHRETQEIVAFFKEGGSCSSSDTENVYESLYEMLPGEATTLKAPTRPAPPPPLDEDEAFDSDVTDSSFDSDSSTDFENVTLRRDEIPPLPELPPPPVAAAASGGSKFAEAANKTMKTVKNLKKNWKKGIGDKLRRLSTPNPIAVMEAQMAAKAAAEKIDPPTPPASTPSLLKSNSGSSKEPSRKYWTFGKNSNKSNRGSTSSSPRKSTDSASIFYVGSADLQLGELGDRANPTRRSITESLCSSGRGSSAGSENDNVPRRPTSVVRPKTPPPPPPTDAAKNGKNSRLQWYADIEISSLQHTGNESSTENVAKNGSAFIERNLSWFSENNLSLNESSGNEFGHNTESSECSSSNTSPDGSVVHGCFADEPLYQFYAESVLEQAQRELNEESDSDGYEEIGEQMKIISRPSAMELIRPRSQTGQRSLWCEIPDVINSGVLDTLNQQQRKVQEAKFEIVTSEASYVKSLGILAKHFVQCPDLQDESVLSKTDKDILFSNIMPVKASSERFLVDLERCWQEDIMLPHISDVVEKHASKNFRVYIKYCSQQIYLDRTLRKLRGNNSSFAEILQRLEADPECQSLSLHSFLMLPMQRVTRLPLLLDAVLRRLSANCEEYDSCKNALFSVNKLVQECNEEARRMERMKDMLVLSRQLEFKGDVKAVPLISSSRWLVRSGELTQLVMRDEAKLTFGRKFGKVPVCIFLFTDILIIAKRKGDESYQVLDYCARNLVEVTSPEELGEGSLSLPVRLGDTSAKHIILLTLLQNHEKKISEMVLSCSLESDKQRWLAAFTPPAPPEDNPEERVYESWDCPQVQALHAYVGQQPDELSLDVADVVNVLRKLPDGWYHGERIKDGECGWFPGNYCKEVVSSHVRARNLRQRYRLLALTREHINKQRKARSSSKSKITSTEKLAVF